MSGKIVGQVWDLELPHNKLIVLLAMADHADHEGGNVYPSMDLVAWKTGYSERHVRRIVSTLEKDGILVKTERPGYTNIYRINLSAGVQKKPFSSKYTTPDKMSDPIKKEDTTPDTQMSDGVGHPDVRPTPDTQMSDEPSLKPSYNHIAPEVSDAVGDVMEKIKIPLLPAPIKVVEKPSRSKKQKANDEKVEALGQAYGVEAKGKDYGFFVKVANDLIAAGIPMDEFNRYIARLRRVAKSQGGWTVTIGSLTSNGRPSEYVAARDKYIQEKKTAPTKQPATTSAEMYDLRIIIGDEAFEERYGETA